MIGANSIFLLMVGAALLTYATMYFLALNQRLDLKQKNMTLNAALCSLQEERAKLIVQSDSAHTENSAKETEIAHLNDEIRELRASLERLTTDNQQTLKEYKSLESLVFESDSSSGILAFQKIMGRYLAK